MAHTEFVLNASASTSSLGLNNYIARELSPSNSNEAIKRSNSPEIMEEESFIWGMQQPSGSNRYHNFPAKNMFALFGEDRRSDLDTAITYSMSQSKVHDGHTAGFAARLKSREDSSTRRRKVTVADLGPMTTVQEVPMDSPTIPGRPPLDYYLHERSISAPGLRSDSWHQNFPDNGSGVSISNDTVQLKGSSSSKALAPLVIPATSNPTPQKLFRSRCPANTSVYSQSSPPQVPPKSKFFLEKNSTKYLATDQTIMYSSTKPELSITSDSAHLTPFTSLNDSPSRKQLTPNISKDKQVETFQHKSASKAAPTRTGHFRGQSDMAHGPALRSDGHRREQSETLIMDRGRPKRRIDKSQDYRPIENERKALETLPQGIKAKQANSRYDDAEIDTLRRQALGQAAKFEVLASKDVDSLSRELRALDERCEYLRKSQSSLRSVQRTFHKQICNYLRSPKIAIVSSETLLKHEEALAELDHSIEIWTHKLDTAENRRIRVRQKLLEHVAAALTLSDAKVMWSEDQKTRHEATKFVNGNFPSELVGKTDDTPPRSPSQTPSQSTSPEQLAAPAEPLPAEVTKSLSDNVVRMSAESIRIYLDSDVYGLLADVEQEMNRMVTVSEGL